MLRPAACCCSTPPAAFLAAAAGPSCPHVRPSPDKPLPGHWHSGAQVAGLKANTGLRTFSLNILTVSCILSSIIILGGYWQLIRAELLQCQQGRGSRDPQTLPSCHCPTSSLFPEALYRNAQKPPSGIHSKPLLQAFICDFLPFCSLLHPQKEDETISAAPGLPEPIKQGVCSRP